MYKEKELKEISDGLVTNFIISRFDAKNTSSRGKHYMQHSRTTIKQYVRMMRDIFSVVKNKWMEIPKGDEYNSKSNPNGYKLSSFPEYEKVVCKAADAGFSSKGSSQSLKKISYVDMERMGLLERGRINPKGKTIVNDLTKKKFSASLVRLTKASILILSEKNNLKWSGMIANQFKKYWGTEYDILYKLIFLENLDYISIEEYTLFVSWIDFSPVDKFDVEKCANIITKWRVMGKNIRESILDFMNRNSKGSHSKKNRIYWDWGNWKNEPATIFNILGDLGLFSFDKKTRKLNGVKTKKGTFKRIKNISTEYNEFHAIEKKDMGIGFEYHHIIPFSWVEDEESHKLIDNFMNCIYLSGTKHNMIPKRNNTLVNLRMDGNYLILFSKSNEINELRLEIDKDIKIKKDKINDLIKYNEKLVTAL